MINIPRSRLLPEPLTPGEIPIPDLSGMNMIIAEDDQYGFEYLKQLFRKTGIEVRHAKDGIQLMQLLDEKTPDIVLLDIHMPEMDGYDCLYEIRAQGLNTLVIMQTASAMLEDRNRCMEAGADGYISKPIRKNELFTLIEAVLNIVKQPK
jgi:DNA-binding response OmpR family regulator